jgi:hypothetical protein
MIFFDVLTIIILVVVFICLPNSNEQWKIGRMSCPMLMIKNKQFHCVWEGRAGICNRDECPMMEYTR